MLYFCTEKKGRHCKTRSKSYERTLYNLAGKTLVRIIVDKKIHKIGTIYLSINFQYLRYHKQHLIL